MSDLISRQDAIDALWRVSDGCESIYGTSAIFDAIDGVKALPSAQPERKKGKWLFFEPPWFRCSECGAVRENKSFMENFCPNCGACMKGEQDE